MNWGIKDFKMPLDLKEQLDIIINHLTALKKEQLSQSRQITAMDKRLCA
jgi:hypothetical protein